MKPFVTLLMIATLLFLLGGCETMKGLGRDMEDAGEWVQKKAD